MLNITQTSDISSIINAVEEVSLKDLKVLASSLKDQGYLRGGVSSVAKKDKDEYTNLMRRTTVAIHNLVNHVQVDGYTVPEGGFSMFGWNQGVSTFNSRCNEDGSEVVETEWLHTQRMSILMDKVLDEDTVYSRGFTGSDGYNEALMYEQLSDEDVETLGLDEVYVLADMHEEYVYGDDWFLPDGDDDAWTTNERDWEMETHGWRAQEARLVRRVEQEMSRKGKVPGLGYFMHGGKMCAVSARDYGIKKRKINTDLKEARTLFTQLLVRRSRLGLQSNKARYVSGLITKEMQQVEGKGQSMKRELADRLTQVRVIHQYYGRVYDPKAYYTHKAVVEGLKGMLKTWYNRATADDCTRWGKLNKAERLAVKEEYAHCMRGINRQ